MKTVVRILHGSHLYGTNTPNSDTDYKTIFIPDGLELLLQRRKRNIRESTSKPHEKNTKDDVDSGFFSLDMYFDLLAEGQTMALDLLFAPPQNILETSPLWEFIQANRGRLIHKNMTAFVGYCQAQAAKYGIKGSRMAAVKFAIEKLSTLDPASKLCEHWDVENPVGIFKELLGTEHIQAVVQPANNYSDSLVTLLEVCNRKFQRTCGVDYTIGCLQKIYDNYGARARAAMHNEGVDWKALSHAIRVCVQGLELLESGNMTLPLPSPQLEIVRAVKLGKLPYTDVQTIIEDYVAKIDGAKASSLLPDALDYNFCDELVAGIYLEHAKKSIKKPLPDEIKKWLM